MKQSGKPRDKCHYPESHDHQVGPGSAHESWVVEGSHDGYVVIHGHPQQVQKGYVKSCGVKSLHHHEYTPWSQPDVGRPCNIKRCESISVASEFTDYSNFDSGVDHRDMRPPVEIKQPWARRHKGWTWICTQFSITTDNNIDITVYTFPNVWSTHAVCLDIPIYIIINSWKTIKNDLQKTINF